MLQLTAACEMLFCLLQLASSLLNGKELKFYQYDGDVNQLLDNVRANLNDLAESWTREQKDHCLKETADAFKVSGMCEDMPNACSCTANMLFGSCDVLCFARQQLLQQAMCIISVHSM